MSLKGPAGHLLGFSFYICHLSHDDDNDDSHDRDGDDHDHGDDGEDDDDNDNGEDDYNDDDNGEDDDLTLLMGIGWNEFGWGEFAAT